MDVALLSDEPRFGPTVCWSFLRPLKTVCPFNFHFPPLNRPALLHGNSNLKQVIQWYVHQYFL